MFTDPFVIKAPALANHTTLTVAETLSFARVQEQGGKAIYKSPVSSSPGTFQVNLTVSHSESNENKPLKTSRALVRIDVNGFTIDGEPASAFAYAVIGVPEGDLFSSPTAASTADSPLSVTSMVQYLLGALATNNSTGALDETKIPRFIAGES